MLLHESYCTLSKWQLDEVPGGMACVTHGEHFPWIGVRQHGSHIIEAFAGTTVMIDCPDTELQSNLPDMFQHWSQSGIVLYNRANATQADQMLASQLSHEAASTLVLIQVSVSPHVKTR